MSQSHLRGTVVPVNCDACLLRQLISADQQSVLDLETIHEFKSGTRYLPAKAQIYVEGEPPLELFTLFSGWAFRYKLLFDGRRQILDFLLPGDFTGLQPDILGTVDHSVETITDVALCVFRRSDVLASLQAQGVLAELLNRILKSEGTVLFEHLVDVGRRSAHEAIAHLVLELYTRIHNRGAAENGRCEFPLNQGHLADALSLSTAHVNRVLRKFREAGLMTIADGTLEILDYEGLAEICDFDDHYVVPHPVI